ncbi:MAG: hypothetical protein WCS84_09805 [Nocardioides sp.]
MGRSVWKIMRPTAAPEAWAELPEKVAQALPQRLLAVGEAQASGTDSVPACREAGRRLAGDGVSLEDALEALYLTSVLVRGHQPDYAELVALSVAWSDATLGYLHRLTCSDPMTGLSTTAHLHGRLAELYRSHDVRRSHALVVVEAPGPDNFVDPVTHRLDLARLGDTVRTVFAGSEIIAGIGIYRIVVLVDRDDVLARRVALLRTLLERTTARVWIEGLPGGELAAGGLLDELARL